MEISINLETTRMISDLRENLKASGLVFEDITDEIIQVKDFLTKDDMDFLFRVIEGASQEDWEVEYLGNLKNFCLEKFGRDDVDNLVAEGKFEITQNWVDKNLNFRKYGEQKVFYDRLSKIISSSFPGLELSGLSTIQRMQPGVELKAHVDQHTDPSIKYSTILYLNDDYVDGELFFSNLGISLRPKPGDLMFFPGDAKHIHGVHPVGDGPIRYIVVGFVKEIGHYVRNRY